ncbi:PTS sugar transporter subunit IIB [Desulfolutivibrio sp.]|uniref:PTS sugar transporter subunit IIB n=1 Tax=Desulfolutivibrio sp. TaxID=2773296 RepID=UPI002F96DBF3
MHFVRIDNRLVHGQVIETWLPHTRARMIAVVNDELAGNMLRQEIMSLAIPDGVDIVFLPVAKMTAFFSGSARQDMDALILFSSCADARAAFESGYGFTCLNLGNLHYAAGKKQICPHVALSKEDETCLRFFVQNGVKIDYRCVPGDSELPRAF